MAKLSTFAEHSVVHEASLVKVDPDLPPRSGCPGLMRRHDGLAFGGVTSRDRPGDTAVVVGVEGRWATTSW
jgi:Zn-dependent alcohol dehydrogenase